MIGFIVWFSVTGILARAASKWITACMLLLLTTPYILREGFALGGDRYGDQYRRMMSDEFSRMCRTNPAPEPLRSLTIGIGAIVMSVIYLISVFIYLLCHGWSMIFWGLSMILTLVIVAGVFLVRSRLLWLLRELTAPVNAAIAAREFND